MTTESIVRIRWHGKESEAEAVECIMEGQPVEIILPSSFHHACHKHLFPDADPGAPDFIDIENGAQIISRITEVPGLEGLSILIDPIKTMGARVIMKSPTPRLYIGSEFNRKWFGHC